MAKMSDYRMFKAQKKCVVCGKQDAETLSGKVRCHECSMKHNAGEMNRRLNEAAQSSQNSTLCWDCDRPGTCTCCWDASLGTEPVPGWETRERTDCKDMFIVVRCPLFVQGRTKVAPLTDESWEYDIEDEFDL